MSNSLDPINKIKKNIAKKRQELFNYTRSVANKKQSRNNSIAKKLLREFEELQFELQYSDILTRPRRSHMGGTRRTRRTRRNRRKSLKNC